MAFERGIDSGISSMKEERNVCVEGQVYPVTISDEKEALLAAAAAKRAVIGLWDKNGKEWPPARYLVESVDDITPLYLEQVVRRNLGLPWIIASTDRLLIREFQSSDAAFVLKEKTDTESDAVFYTADALERYIRCQYGFYGYGIWALIEKDSGILIGMAGVVNGEGGEAREANWAGEGGEAREDEESSVGGEIILELGYPIFEPYRGKGYAKEACGEILKYADSQLGVCTVYAKIDASNEASIRVAESCGFSLMERKYTEESLCMYRYVWCSPQNSR